MEYRYTLTALLLLTVLLAAAGLRQVEKFAASQGGVLVQLASSHVASEEEVAMNREYEKRRVTQDIYDMTEPDRSPGPKPLGSFF